MVDLIRAARERDPAARGVCGALEIVLTYSGFHAILAHRLNHFLWRRGIPVLPRMLSQLAKLLTGIEIHPGAEIGRGLFIDHGTGVVIGETAVIGDDVTLYQGVTLGGTGKETGKRHPTLGDNVVVGAGGKILGDITIGNDVRVGAGSVVVKPVPDHCTVVGVPGRIVREKGERVVDAPLAHGALPDPLAPRIEALEERLRRLESLAGRSDGECGGEPER